MGQKANSAVIDIDYLTGRHHKLSGVSEIDRCRYLAIWGLAIKLGRELLPEAYNGDDMTALREALGAKTNARRLADSLSMLCSRRLLVLPILQSSKRIAVVGLKVRYPKRDIDDFDPSPWFGLVWIGSVKKELKTPTESSAEPTPEEPTRELSGHQKDIRDITDFWQAHFIGNGKEPPSPSFVGKILVNCRRVGVSPTWLIGKIKPDHANTEAMALFYFKPGESLPSMTDAERRDNSYAAWERRDRGGGTLLGDVLRKRLGAENEAET